MTMKRLITGFLLTVQLGVVACGSDGSSAADTGVRPDGGVTGDAGEAPQCGEGTVHQQLLNAPTSATVIQKTPTHPPVGAGGLP